MKKNNLTIALMFVLMLSAMIFTSCAEEYPDPLWPGDNPDGGPAPTITSVTPPDTAWTDADTVVIVGTNFSDDISLMHVAFGGVRGEIVASSTTQMSILPPTNFKDSMTIKVDRSGSNGALVFAEYSPYSIKNPFSKPGDPIFAEADMIYGIAADNNGNVFLTKQDKSNQYITKLLPDGTRIDNYCQAFVNTPKALKFGQGNLYCMDGTYTSKTDTATGVRSYGSLASNTYDLDFDSNGNLFFVGKNAIYKVDPSDLGVNEVAYDYTDYKLNAARVYNGYLYVGGVYSGSDTTIAAGQQNIWKHSIASDGSLGDQVNVIDWTSYYSSIISAIEFDENGNMFVGTVSTGDVASDGIIKISVNGNHSYLYPQLLRGDIVYSVYKMTWTGDYMYCSIRDGADASNNTVIKLNMFSKSAPYHNR
ncbi:MAG: IPT/TIG domain-containing protein [Candidatus Marinimicrobia bacterium]|nr:IPT/TIG domain-containing protein [Candidatus Neomarinimicrobiota bacterium]